MQDPNVINIFSIMHLLDRLAGSVKIPNEYKGLTAEEIVYKAKKEYFRNKRGYFISGIYQVCNLAPSRCTEATPWEFYSRDIRRSISLIFFA